MRAVIWTEYGPPDVLRIGDLPIPEPRPHEVRVAVRATTVTAGDTEMRSLNFPGWVRIPMRLYMGLLRPKRVRVPGMAVSGVIDKVGERVTRFAEGDEVMAANDLTFGAHAEFVCLAEAGMIVPKPPSVSHLEAASLPVGANEALSFLQRAHVSSGQQVMVYGAGGTIGTFTVQLAHQAGATVTAADVYEKHDMLKEIGANVVVDHQSDDLTSGRTYDVIVDVVGKLPLRIALRLLSPDGTYVIANPRPAPLLFGKLRTLFSRRRVMMAAASEDPANLLEISRLCEENHLRVIMDRVFPLEEIVEAHRFAESGRKQGNIGIVVAE